jgi:hypothetical protein
MSGRDPHELLSRADIAAQYRIGARSQISWAQTNRHGWASLCFRVGGKVFVRRGELEGWLDQQRMEPKPNDGAALRFDNNSPRGAVGVMPAPPPARLSRRKRRAKR